MWRRGEDAAAGRQTPTGLLALSSVVPVPISESAEERAEEEVLLALRMMCQSGLRHPLHGHSYSRYTALRPRVCCSCEAPVFGPFSKACHCLTCGIIVHRQCVQRITRVPCGSYRGLRDPEGIHSRIATAGEKTVLESSCDNEANAAGTEAVARSERKADMDASLGDQEAEAEEEEVMWQRDNTGVRVTDIKHENGKLEKSPIPGIIDAADAAPSSILSSSPTDNSSSFGTGSGARRMTYDALARVGALVGSMVSGGGGVGSGGDPKEASVVATSGGSFTSSSIFSFSALRGAGAVAGAYTGYRQQGGDRRHSSIGGSSEAAAPPSPVAMAWSRLAQRLSRPEGGGGGGGGAGAFLDLATFARSLEEDHKEEKKEKGEENDNVRSPGSRLVDSSTPLIGQILRCPQTPPGFVWAACLDHFAARHAASAGVRRAPSPDIPTTKAEGEGEGEDKATAGGEEASVPAGSCCEDAAAIIHEVALVLMEYVPGLLGSSLEAYEEAFEAVETEIMTTLYPSVLRECQNQVRALSRAVEAWYRQQPAEHEEEEEVGGLEGAGEAVSADAHYHKAAQELVGMSREVTGRKKVQRVLGACLALGEGNLVMTADELLPALGRVVRLARVPALPAHLAFIEETCDTGALLGAEGYALTSLQVVVSLIITPPTEEGRGAEEEEEEQEEERG